jgi:hypothetical protein
MTVTIRRTVCRERFGLWIFEFVFVSYFVFEISDLK